MSGMIRIGGLWVNRSRKGLRYLSGELSQTARLHIFKNEKKKGNDPDYVACIAFNYRKDQKMSEGPEQLLETDPESEKTDDNKLKLRDDPQSNI